MLMEVRKHLKLIYEYFKVNLSAGMEYRTSFLVQVFGMALNNSAFIFFWWILYERIPSIAGYGFNDVLFIWALASSSFGFVHIVFGNILNLSDTIIKGELDTYLVQPKDVYINVLCSRTRISAWGDLAYGYVLFIPVFGWGKVFLFTLFVVFGGLLMGSIFAAAHTLTFFTGNANAIARLVVSFTITFTTYPEGIYKGALKWMVYSFLPAGFIVFLPHRILKAFNWWSVLILIIVDVLYITAGYYFFRAGLKKYESGNLITTKL